MAWLEPFEPFAPQTAHRCPGYHQAEPPSPVTLYQAYSLKGTFCVPVKTDELTIALFLARTITLTL